jgi:hypothetical protein
VKHAEVVLVCTDFSTASAAGEREAIARFAAASLVVLHVVDERLAQRVVNLTGMDKTKLLEEMTAYADQRLVEVVERMRSQGRRVSADLGRGDPIEGALAAARRHAARAIVLGVEAGRAIGRFRTLLARRSTVPLIVVPMTEV